MHVIKKFGIFFLILFLFSVLVTPVFADKTETTLTDLTGKQITLKTPVDRMVLQGSGGGGPFFTLLALDGKEGVKKIVAMDNTLEENRNDVWEKYCEAIPELKDIPKTGSHTADLNPETVISLKPDVVVVPLDEYKGAVDIFKKLEEAGIPVVVMDYHAETLENHQKSIEIMGKLLGKEEKATELFNYYKSQMDLVNSRLSAITGPKPRVYVECASKNASELSNTYGDYMWGALVKKCRGDNIAEGSIETYGSINQEYLLSKDPEVIIYTGSYWPKEPNSFRLGFKATEQSAHDTLKPYLHREGWESMSAIKNNRVYGISHILSRDIMDFAAFQFIAKALYPKEFADIDPEKNLAEFYDTYLPVKLSGVWMTEAGKNQ